MQSAKNTGGRAGRLAALALLAFSLLPAAAARAVPPSVTSVTAGLDVRAQWTLPAGMKTYSIEIAASPETYEGGDSKGSFIGANWAHAAILLQTPEATSWRGRQLPFGTYYAHVSAIDGTTCTSPLALGCPKEWSETVAFSAPRRTFGIGLTLLGDRKPYIFWSNWCCTPEFDIGQLEIATDPDVYPDGPLEGLFLDENLVLSASAPFTTATSYTSTRPLAGGVYYMNAVGVDRSYCPTDDPSRLVCGDEVSKPVRFTVAPTPPVLEAARQEGGVIDLEWSLPFGMRSDFVEVATAPDVYASGPLRGGFRDENLVWFDDGLFAQERSYIAAEPLPPGTYYAHVAAYVSGSCSSAFPPGCFDEYTDTARITVPGPPAPQRDAVPAATSADTQVAFSLLRARKVQSARRLSVLVMLDEDAFVRVSGRVRVSGSSRRFSLRPVRRLAKAHTRLAVSLKLSQRALAAVRRAIARHRQVKARVSITARDRAGNEIHRSRGISLKG